MKRVRSARPHGEPGCAAAARAPTRGRPRVAAGEIRAALARADV